MIKKRMTCLEKDKDKGLTIGGLAKAACVGLGTIRHYQTLGLIDRPIKPKLGGFRRYFQKDVERLHLIRNAQALGFTLKEIGDILQHRERSDCHSLHQLLISRKALITNQIHELENSLARLIKLSTDCHEACTKSENHDCPLIRSFISERFPLSVSQK